MEKNDRLKKQFNLGGWQRWDYDLEKATLTFSQDGQPKVIARIQVVGSTSDRAQNWLWAWANSWWPQAVTEDAACVREFGQKNGVDELTSEYLKDESLNDLGWAMAAVTARVVGSLGAYRAPGDNGLIFLVYREIAFAQ